MDYMYLGKIIYQGVLFSDFMFNWNPDLLIEHDCVIFISGSVFLGINILIVDYLAFKLHLMGWIY